MAQKIKYNTGSKTTSCCITKNNFDIGVVSDYQYGPTSSTDFWAGYDIPAGGFVTYQNKASQGPSIYEIPSLNDVWKFGTQLNIGPVLPNANAYVIRVAANLNDLLLVNVNYPELPQINNNILTLDVGYTPSCGWSTSEWFDVAGGSVTQAVVTGTTTFITGSSTYNYSDSSFGMNANAQNSMAFANAFSSTLTTFTINIWIAVNTGNDYDVRQNIIGQQYSTDPGYAPQNDCNFLIRGNGTNGYQGLIRRSGTNYTVNFGAVGTGTWKMLTLTYDGDTLSAYLDSSMVDQQFIGPNVTLSNGLQTIIGGTVNARTNMGVPAYFDGRVGVVNIYDTALNLGEIAQLYTNYQTQRNYT
jgi:hypothetical protein